MNTDSLKQWRDWQANVSREATQSYTQPQFVIKPSRLTENSRPEPTDVPSSKRQKPVDEKSQGGGGYIMYNNKKYKICTGKRGGKYIRVGVDKKKIYV